jgi:hypothetical protein
LARRGGGRVEGLLAPFRVLAGGQDLETAGAALLEQACQAFEAEEGAVLLAEGAFVPGPCWGRPGPPGRLGTRRGDRELVADAVATGRPLAAGAAAREAWCAMVVGGKAVGVLALRRGSGPPFTGEERAAGRPWWPGPAAARRGPRGCGRWPGRPRRRCGWRWRDRRGGSSRRGRRPR